MFKLFYVSLFVVSAVMFVGCGNEPTNARVVDCSLGADCDGAKVEKPK